MLLGVRDALSTIQSKIEAHTEKSGQPISLVIKDKNDLAWETGRGDEKHDEQ